MALNFEVSTTCFFRGTPNSNSWMWVFCSKCPQNISPSTHFNINYSLQMPQMLLQPNTSQHSDVFILTLSGWEGPAHERWQNDAISSPPLTVLIAFRFFIFKELSYICSWGFMRKVIEISRSFYLLCYSDMHLPVVLEYAWNVRTFDSRLKEIFNVACVLRRRDVAV